MLPRHIACIGRSQSKHFQPQQPTETGSTGGSLALPVAWGGLLGSVRRWQRALTDLSVAPRPPASCPVRAASPSAGSAHSPAPPTVHVVTAAAGCPVHSHREYGRPRQAHRTGRRATAAAGTALRTRVTRGHQVASGANVTGGGTQRRRTPTAPDAPAPDTDRGADKRDRGA